MRPIDEKIVSMKLDNSDFAKKAADTTGIIGGLTRVLNLIPGVNLGKTTKDLSNIHDAANGINFSALNAAVDTVSKRFSAMGLVGMTVLQNLTNKAVDTGLQMTKSLTTDQISSGFSEYELKIKSIQTILSNTQWAGTGLKDVQKSLEDLNDYADKTIYNFSEMTASIGRFTTAGVKLDDATTAIKGMSNLAAASGSDVNQLNTAMYQMSQAMASGKITLMDWNSLVNAGMAGKKTQDALLATAKAMGKNVDMTDGFRNSLEKGWLTSNVFLETMKKFSTDQSMLEAATKVRTFSGFMDNLKESIGSGWATTFENIFGDFNESTNLWSGVADKVTGVVGRVSDARNKFLSDAADKGAMKNIFDGIGNAIKPLGQIIDSFKEGFDRVFPAPTVDRFVQMTKTFKEFTAGLTLTRGETSQLTIIFQGMFAAINTAWIIAKKLGSALSNLIPEGTGGSIMNMLGNLAQMSIEFNKSVKAGDGLTSSIDGLGRACSAVGNGIKDVFGLLGTLGSAISEVWNILVHGDFTGKGPWDEDSKIVDWLFNLRDAFIAVGNWFKTSFKDLFGGIGMNEVLGGATLAGGFLIFKKIHDVLGNLSGTLKSFKFGIRETLGGFGDALNAFTQQVKYNNLLKIAISVGLLAASLKLLEGMKAEDLTRGIYALGASLGTLMGAMAIMDKFNITGGIRASIALIAMATAVTIMASALKKVAELNFEEVFRGVTGLIGVTSTLAFAIIAISKWGGELKVGSLQLIALATAVRILADSIQVMSSIDTGQLWKAVGALGVIFAELAIFLKIVNGAKFGVSSAVGLIAVAAAIRIMVASISVIADMDAGTLTKGLVTIAAILAELAIFSKVASGGSLILSGVGLMLVATALTELMIPMKVLGGMSLEELAKGIGGIALSMIAIGAASKLMSGSIGAGLGLIAVATGMTMLLVPLKVFAGMSWADMLKGFAGLALTMGVLAGASLLLTPAIVPMLGFGAALLLMGTAMFAAGAGVGLFAAGLGALAGLTVTSVAAIISALKMLLEGLGSLIVSAVKLIVDLGVALIKGLDELVPPLIKTIADIVVALLTTIVERLPEFLKLGSEFIIRMIKGMSDYFPKIIDAGVQMIIDVVNGLSDTLRDKGPQVVDAFMRLFGEIIILVIDTGLKMIDALFGWIPGVKKATSEIGSTAEQFIRDSFGAAAVGTSKGNDFVEGLSGAEGGARVAGIGLANAGKDGLGSVDIKPLGINFGQGFISGIKSMAGSVVDAAKGMAGSASDAVKDFLHIHSPSRVTREQGGWFGEGLALGILDKTKRVSDGAKDLAKTAKNSLGNFLDGLSLQPDDNEVRIKAVLDYEKLDPSKFGDAKNVSVTPDSSFTNSMVSAVKSKSGQNGDNTSREKSTNSNTESDNSRPIVIQSILNGRVIAEETFSDTNQLFNNRTNLDYAMGGV